MRRSLPSFEFEDAPLLFTACEAVGAEGIVLKDGAGRYQPGVRTAGWRKAKVTAWRSHLERRFARRFT